MTATADTQTAFGEGVVLLTRHAGIATVTINRPKQHNALSSATWQGLGAAVAAADADPAVSVVVVRGAGHRAFSAGADIKEFETTRATEAGAQAHQDTVQACLGALEAAAKPMIAMIHGYCIGGGCEVALMADIRIADERAEIGIPSAKMGILLELGYIRRLVATVGPANASQMLFTGQRFPAARALQMGLVNEVVPSDALEAHTYALAGTIRDAAPTSVRWAKRSIQAILRDPTLQSYTDWEMERVSVSESPEFREGVRAFLEKRQPRFNG
ncbi:MAG: enoyl-CoA hydratase/isomerase family protein [Chloroflexi bacterium]|nr:enoyl-CoA hydratase/isomerase family protein [Chloroflexota bacterium]